MEPEMRSQATGGAVCVLAGVIILLVHAPALLGLLLIVIGMVVLGVLLAGYPSVVALVRDRRSGRRPRRR